MRRYVIVGNGVAGLAAALSIREQDREADIALIGEERHPPYFRAGLSEWMHGAIDDEELHIRPAATLDGLGLRTLNARAARLDVDAHTVTLEDGQSLPWDKLLVATGARPFAPPWPGTDLRGFFTYRTWDDCAAISAAVTAQPDKPAVIIGAGILGLEVAWNCAGLGVPVVMIVRGARVGTPIFDDDAADMLLRRLRDDGVEVHLEEEVGHFEGDDGELVAVVTRSGRRVACSAVVAAVGVRPETSLLEGTGIAMDRWVKVDAHLRTSHPDVYAAGDVATVFDPMLQAHAPTRTWEPSYWGGRAAGENMAGKSKQYVPCTTMNASLVYDLKYVLLGGFLSHGPDVEAITDAAPRGRYGYRKLLIKDEAIVGGTFLDDRRHYLAYWRLMQTRVKITELKDRLLRPDFDPNLALQPGTLDYYFF